MTADDDSRALVPASRRAVRPGAGRAIEGRERDFLLLTLFVLIQHRLFDKAAVLATAMLRAGDETRETLLAHAVVQFCRNDFEATLASLSALDRVDPVERYGRHKLTERQRMRSYLRARSLYELGAVERNAIDLYLRQRGPDEPGEG